MTCNGCVWNIDGTCRRAAPIPVHDAGSEIRARWPRHDGQGCGEYKQATDAPEKRVRLKAP